MTTPDTANFSWDQLATHCRTLATAVEARGHPDLIVAISRGGLFPALLLSHLLAIREVEAIGISTTIDDSVRAKRTPPQVYSIPPRDRVVGRHCLVVDDITNTGDTMAVAVNALMALAPASVMTAAMIWDTVGTDSTERLVECRTDMVAHTVHAWVNVPWEI